MYLSSYLAHLGSKNCRNSLQISLHKKNCCFPNRNRRFGFLLWANCEFWKFASQMGFCKKTHGQRFCRTKTVPQSRNREILFGKQRKSQHKYFSWVPVWEAKTAKILCTLYLRSNFVRSAEKSMKWNLFIAKNKKKLFFAPSCRSMLSGCKRNKILSSEFM